VVGALGLLTMISMSVFERQKEIGVMRSIGAGSFTVAMQFLTEGVIVGILAWLIGLPISYGLSALITSALGLGDAFKLTYPLSAPVAGVVGMLVITALASLYPSISASRKTVSDILRYQ
jgi:putative ABC transport system permease protein